MIPKFYVITIVNTVLALYFDVSRTISGVSVYCFNKFSPHLEMTVPTFIPLYKEGLIIYARSAVYWYSGWNLTPASLQHRAGL